MQRKEIAEALGISQRTVKDTLYRAMKKARVRMVMLDLIDKGYSDDDIAEITNSLGSDGIREYLQRLKFSTAPTIEEPCYNNLEGIAAAARISHDKLQIIAGV